jgi:hypothetical protein
MFDVGERPTLSFFRIKSIQRPLETGFLQRIIRAAIVGHARAEVIERTP